MGLRGVAPCRGVCRPLVGGVLLLLVVGAFWYNPDAGYCNVDVGDDVFELNTGICADRRFFCASVPAAAADAALCRLPPPPETLLIGSS